MNGIGVQAVPSQADSARPETPIKLNNVCKASFTHLTHITHTELFKTQLRHSSQCLFFQWESHGLKTHTYVMGERA